MVQQRSITTQITFDEHLMNVEPTLAVVQQGHSEFAPNQ